LSPFLPDRSVCTAAGFHPSIELSSIVIDASALFACKPVPLYPVVPAHLACTSPDTLQILSSLKGH